MALQDQVTLAADTAFQGRVKQAIIAAAIAIVNEAISTGFHSQRVRLAAAIVNAPSTYAPLFAAAVATDTTVQSSAGSPPVQASVTDANINAAVAAVWNSFFNVFS